MLFMAGMGSRCENEYMMKTMRTKNNQELQVGMCELKITLIDKT